MFVLFADLALHGGEAQIKPGPRILARTMRRDKMRGDWQ